jgi:hypothetical protein
MPASSQDFYICPGCGAEVPVGSRGCSGCAAQSARRRSPRIPHEDDFDYEAFIAEEFGHPIKPRGLAWHWWVTALLVLAALLWQIVGHL